MLMRTVLAFLSVLPLLSQASPALRRADAVLIHPNGYYQVLGCHRPQNDAPTEILDCLNLRIGQYVRWEIAEGDNLSVQLAGTNFCLDAGTNPHNNGPAKVYQCFPGLTQQHWYYTADERIAITGGNQCLDQTNGNGAPQTYQCTTGNTNQVWGVSDAGPGPTTTLSSTTSTTPTSTTTSPTSTATFFYAPSNGTQLNFNGNTRQCLSVTNGYAATGTAVALVTCFGATDPAIGFQLWTLTRNAPTQIVLTLPQHGTSYCLTYGTQQNGGGAFVSPCESNNAQQTFWYTEDNHVSLYNGDQCLDVVAGSQPTSQKPYGTLQNVQTWACSGTDKQQIWTSSIAL